MTDLIEVIKSGDYQQLLVLAMKLYTDGKGALNDYLKSDEPINLTRSYSPRRAGCLLGCDMQYRDNKNSILHSINHILKSYS